MMWVEVKLRLTTGNYLGASSTGVYIHRLLTMFCYRVHRVEFARSDCPKPGQCTNVIGAGCTGMSAVRGQGTM